MSIFDGFDALINEALRLTPKQSIDHKSVYKKFKPTEEIMGSIKPLVFALYGQIERNWQGSPPSDYNWAIRRKTNLAEHHTSPETLLERSIAIIADRNLLDGWYNQMPIASGLINAYYEKTAAVDLIYLNEDQLELVELKWESNTPLYAIFEILRYGLVYLFCFNKRKAFGLQNLETMTVSSVLLSTLAPETYYSYCDFQWLTDELDTALNFLFMEKSDGLLSCQFNCNAFPEDFSLPFAIGSEVKELENCSTDDPTLKYIAENLNNRSTVEWNKA